MFKEKRKRVLRQKKFFQIFFSIWILILVGFLAFSNFKISQKRKKLNVELQILKEKVAALKEKKAQLEAGISQTKKESYWEEKIRQEGYVREGENPVVILPPPAFQKEETSQQQNFSKSLLEKVKQFFQ